MKLAILEDELPEAEKLKKALERFAGEEGQDFSIDCFQHPLFFLDQFHGGYDIIFLDIQMPNCDGVSAAKQIRVADSQVVLIFITNMVQRAVDGYSVQALDFVIKPWTYEHLKQTMLIALKHCRREKPPRMEVKVGSQVLYLELDDILYLEVMRHRLYYHLRDGRVLEAWGNLGDAEQTLPPGQFSRCNNCYLVNLKHVCGINQDMVQVGSEQLKISRGRKTEFISKMMDYI